MNKKDFVQRVIARSLPKLDKVEAGVRYAERVWDKLSALGYGAPKQAGPRDAKDWYRELSAFQRQWFDEFWSAFNYRKGRDGAAKRWAQLPEDPKLYKAVIDGARRTAKTPVPDGQSRKWAEGWLNERRWLDDTAPAKKPDDRRQQITNMMGDLEGLKRLQKGAPSEHIEKQITALEQRLQEARRGG